MAIKKGLFDPLENFEGLVNRVIYNLDQVAKAVADRDQPVTPQLRRQAREAETFVRVLRQDLDQIGKAQKAAAAAVGGKV